MRSAGRLIECIKSIGTVGLTCLIGLAFAATASFAQQEADVCDCTPVSGQPAADVLASHDRWGNPTFIGGITNGGPDSGSVW